MGNHAHIGQVAEQWMTFDVGILPAVIVSSSHNGSPPYRTPSSHHQGQCEAGERTGFTISFAHNFGGGKFLAVERPSLRK